MKIAFVGKFDPAAAGQNYANAIEKHGLAECFCLYEDEFYCAPRRDANPRSSEGAAIIGSADAVILHAVTGEYGDIIADAGARLIYWLDGSKQLRGNPGALLSRMDGRRSIATNGDVADIYGSHYLPCCVAPYVEDQRWAWKPVAQEDKGKPYNILLHFVSDASVKNVSEAKGACDHAASRWRYLRMGGRRHEEAMQQMACARAVFDHMQGYFGVATVEGTAAGMPVINGMSERQRVQLAEWGAECPPWLHATDTDSLAMCLDRIHRGDAPGGVRGWYDEYFSNEIKARKLVEWIVA